MIGERMPARSCHRQVTQHLHPACEAGCLLLFWLPLPRQVEQQQEALDGHLWVYQLAHSSIQLKERKEW